MNFCALVFLTQEITPLRAGHRNAPCPCANDGGENRINGPL